MNSALATTVKSQTRRADMSMLRGIGPLEIFLILVVVMIFFGVGKLPQVGKGMGQAIKEFKSNVRDRDDGKDKGKDGVSPSDNGTGPAKEPVSR
jgi:sec-independent protein translocase protein TatA